MVLAPNEPASTFSLPQPNDPNAGPDQYTVGLATTSSYMQLDDLGCPLFFAVNGDLYDGKGYRIMAGGDLNCGFTPGCLLPGSSELVVAPVPGRCGQWYLFHTLSVTGALADPVLHVSVLDMTMQNPRFPGDPERRGRVLNDTDLDNEGYDLVQNWPIVSDIAVDLGSPFNDQWAANERCLHMDAVRCEAEDRTFLFASNGEVLARYELTPSGVVLRGSQPVDLAGAVLNPSLRPRTAKGELEAVAVGSTIRVAMSITLFSDQTLPPPPDYNAFLVHVAAYDASLPNVPRTFYENVPIGDLLINEPAPPTNLGTTVTYPGAGGIEFAGNGELVYWCRSLADHGQQFWDGLHHLGTFDWTTLTVSSFPSIGLLPSVDTELELGPAPDGLGEALYLAGTDAQGNAWLGALVGPDDPNTATWLPQAITLDDASLCADPSLAWNNGQDRYHLLQAQGHADASLDLMKDVGCCAERQAMTCTVVYTATTGQSNWTSSDNPFCDKPIVRICQELRIPPGAHVTAQDLTFAFSADAALIIEPGASLTCTNCTFTSACEGEWWKGIRVEGTTSDMTQSQQFQGRLSLWSSEVRNATVGVWCARELAPDVGDPDHYGGRVYTSNSTFRNNITGARIERFHRVVNNDEEYNLCYFANTDFITDANWPDPGTHPLYHARLQAVNGVTFSMCAFRNDDFQSYIPKERGWGLLAVDATFVCTGGSDHQQNKFENLALGILALVPDPALNYILDGMGFQNNAYYGLIDFQGRNPRITNNAFQTLGTDLLPGGTASCGLYLWSTEGYLVERNTFVGAVNAPSPTAGIWFRGPSTDDNEIYDNDFDGLTVASMAYGNHVGPSPIGTNTKPGLQWLCGDHGVLDDNNFDQMVLPDLTLVGNIRAKQGDYALPEFSANNTYHSARSCPGSTWDVYVEPLLNPADVDVEYYYLAHNASPEMRPRCIHEPLPALTPLSFVDEYYDLVAIASTMPFDPEDHCDNGQLDDLDDGPVDHVAQLNAYQLRLQELASAITQYHGEVDGGDKPDLLDLIEQNDPWQPSYVLRDEMLLQTPLSDEVLVAAIWREEPMDPWHLTQVLIANSELSNAVWQALEESVVLAPYYLALLDQYEGEPSTRAPYEQEVALRHAQKSRLQHALFRYYAQDTSRTGNMTDSIDLVLAMDTSYSGRRLRYELACHRGDQGLALLLKDELFGTEGADDLSLIGSLTLHYGTGWDTITGGDLADLEPLALDEGRHGGAVAWGRLLHLRQLDSLPHAIIPEQYRGPWRARPRGVGSDRLGLVAYPNPANERAIITLPKGVGPSVLTVYSPMGAVVDGIAVKDGQPFVELTTRHWTPGIHLCLLRSEGLVLGEAKLNIQH